MIYCPECGTANRDGSNFCNNCGKRLTPGETRRCPTCNAVNPPEAEVCRECGARLAPLRLSEVASQESAPESITQPEMPSKENLKLPDWLQRLRAAARGDEVEEKSAESPAPAPEETSVTPEAESPELPAQGPPAEPEKMETGIPAWMKEGAMPTEAPPAGEEGLPSAAPPELPKLPDWLRDVVAAEESKEAAVAEAKEGPEQEALQWLREMVTDEEEAEEPTTLVTEGTPTVPAEGEQPPTEEGPSGLQEEVTEAGEKPTGMEEVPMAVPRGLSEPEPGVEIPTEEGAVIPPEEALTTGEPLPEEREAPPPAETWGFILEPAIPDWLRGATQVPAATLESADKTEEEEEIPDWLRDLVAPEKPAEAREPPQETMEERPGWQPVVDLSAQPSEGEALAKAKLPDWLRELAPQGVAEEIAAAEEAPSGLAKVEIPDWLEAMRPGQVTPETEPEKTVEGSGLLAGIRGILPIEMVWALPRRAQAAPPPPLPSAKTGPAELFADILAGHPEKRAVAVMKGRMLALGGIERRLIYLLLALVMVVPLFFGVEWLGQGIAVSQPTWGLFDAINKLSADSVVLLSFDYDLATAAELDLQARAIMAHLLEKRSRMIAVSLVPQGPELAQAAWRRAAQDGDYLYGRDFLNLGYLAGKESALRLLAQNLGGAFTEDFQEHKPLEDHALMRGVKSFQDVALAVVLSGDQMYVRHWIEQVQSQVPVKMAAGVAALAGPAVLPYYRSGQLTGLLAGMSGAAEYEVATNRPAIAVSSWGVQSLAHLAIILVILLGNLVSLATWIRRRK